MLDLLLLLIVVIFGVLVPPVAIVDVLRWGQTRWHPTYRQVMRDTEPVQFWLHVGVYVLVWAGGIALAVSGLRSLFGK